MILRGCQVRQKTVCVDAPGCVLTDSPATRTKTKQAARGECAELGRQLTARASTSQSELRAEVAAEARCIAGLPIGDAVPLAVRSYIKVLEHSVQDSEARCQSLQRDALAAANAERGARQALTAAHEQAGLAERALQQQTRRLHALEALRLQDIRVRILLHVKLCG